MLSEVTLVHKDGQRRVCKTEGLELNPRPVVRLRFGYAGLYLASLTHGWVESSDWRLSDSDLEALRAEANSRGAVIWPMPRAVGGGRARAVRVPVVHPRQEAFEWAK